MKMFAVYYAFFVAALFDIGCSAMIKRAPVKLKKHNTSSITKSMKNKELTTVSGKNTSDGILVSSREAQLYVTLTKFYSGMASDYLKIVNKEENFKNISQKYKLDIELSKPYVKLVQFIRSFYEKLVSSAVHEIAEGTLSKKTNQTIETDQKEGSEGSDKDKVSKSEFLGSNVESKQASCRDCRSNGHLCEVCSLHVAFNCCF